MDGKTILAFVPVGQKFTQCSSYTEVTAQVDCKVTMFTSVTSVAIPDDWCRPAKELSRGEPAADFLFARTRWRPFSCEAGLHATPPR